MRPLRHVRPAAAVAACAAALALVLAASAQAAVTASWTVVFTHHYGTAGNYSGYSAVAAVGPADVWAFGSTNVAGLPAPGTPVAVHWNGTGWAPSRLPSGLTSEVIAASAVSADDVWAVTEVGGDILHWNGAQWSVAKQVSGTPQQMFTGVTALSSSDVWAFGGPGAGPGFGAWHFNGKTWASVAAAGGIFSASAVSASDIWAVANNPQDQPDIMHYNGTAWRGVTAAPALGYAHILALSGSNVWATGMGPTGTAYLVHFSGGQWTELPLPWSGLDPGCLAPDGHGGLWLCAAGSSHGWIVHRSASGHWSRIAASFSLVTLVPGTTTGVAVGSTATATGSDATVWAHGTLG